MESTQYQNGFHRVAKSTTDAKRHQHTPSDPSKRPKLFSLMPVEDQKERLVAANTREKAKIKAIRAELAQALTDLADAQASHSSTKELILLRSTAHDILSRRLAAAQDAIGNQSTVITDKKASVKKLTHDVAILHHQMEQVEAQHHSTTSRLTMALHGLASSQATIDLLQAEIAKQQQEKAALQRLFADLAIAAPVANAKSTACPTAPTPDIIISSSTSANNSSRVSSPRASSNGLATTESDISHAAPARKTRKASFKFMVRSVKGKCQTWATFMKHSSAAKQVDSDISRCDNQDDSDGTSASEDSEEVCATAVSPRNMSQWKASLHEGLLRVGSSIKRWGSRSSCNSSSSSSSS